MEKFLTIKGIDRIAHHSASQEYLNDIIETYDLHEIVEQDLLEKTTQDKIDVYDQCLFLIMNFPKYDQERDKYLLNEFDIILGKDYIVTLSKYKSNHIEKIREEYKVSLEDVEADEQYKFSPYYILYKLIDVMYDKVLRAVRFFGKDLALIEDTIYDAHHLDKTVLEQIMVKRRNIVALKHMIQPHAEIIEQLQEETLKFYGGDLDVYFEDLSYKIDRILTNVQVQAENIDSLYDTYNALVSMKTNSIITVLTIFTAVIGMMTLITGFYGMNILLPGAGNTLAVLYICGTMFIFGCLMLLFFRKQKRM